mmetsp:Transcript_24838/g.59115  ORF Transcript_24838/g.59115 Transcript_24838/m.59115 type:complete len:829 (+) Transcript_24838:232-2718(+)
MSVFKAREWWGTKIGDDEELDGACFAVGNVDNEDSGASKLVVGSFSGFLRIYRPSQKEFRAEDLKVEQQMGAPILQVEIGIFGSHSQKELQLAVLHPRRLVTYTVQAVPTEEGGSDTFFQLSLLNKHSLNRSAFNFTYGGFGGAKGKDLIAVQSLDGEITIIEQDKISFSVFLPDFLVPGPLCYVPYPNDVFVTVNSQFDCQAFKYSVLGSMSSGTIAADDDKAKENKRARAEWTVCLGESAGQICAAKHTPGLKASQYDIIIMGEHTLFWLKEGGGIRTQKRLDFNPVAILPYTTGTSEQQNLLVATDQGHLMVYGSGLQLLWAASLDLPPIALGIANAPSIKGLVASVGGAGQLSLTYMGTDPPTQVVNASDKKALNYEQMDEEHRQLLTVIREATADAKVEPTDRLVIRAQVPAALDAGTEGQGWQRLALTAKLFLSYTGSEAISDVTVSVTVPPPFKCSTPTQVVSSVGGGGTPRTLVLIFGLAAPSIPADTTATVAAMYVSKTGEPRTVSTSLSLPLLMCCKVVPSIKTPAPCKVTLDSNRNPPPLPALFEELLPATGPSAAQSAALTFMHHSSVDVTILVSKNNAGRYRIQGGSLEALWLIARELTERLGLHFNTKSPTQDDPPFQMSYSEDVTEPLQMYMGVMEQHFALRLQLDAVHSELEAAAAQFRAVEKRLLVRFKDRNPQPIQALDSLLQLSLDRVLVLSEQGSQLATELQGAATALAASTRLLHLILKLRFGLDEPLGQILEDHWPAVVIDGVAQDGQGWEEMVEASLSLLIKTALSKDGGKKDAGNMAQGPPQRLKDLNKIRKHIETIIKRLSDR